MAPAVVAGFAMAFERITVEPDELDGTPLVAISREIAEVAAELGIYDSRWGPQTSGDEGAWPGR